MNSMEENIKNLQEIINLCNEELDNEDENVTAVLDLVDLKSLRNLIKAYKELEEERQIVGMPVRNKRDGRIGIVLHQWKSGSVAVLESINPRVINTHDSWNTLEIVTDEVKQTKTKCETIPVSLVEEKIEELNNSIDLAIDNSKGGLDEEFIEKGSELLAQKKVLQELLEKR